MVIASFKVVLASGLDMESGFSRELFLEWCTDVKNTVIVTGKFLKILLLQAFFSESEIRRQTQTFSFGILTRIA